MKNKLNGIRESHQLISVCGKSYSISDWVSKINKDIKKEGKEELFRIFKKEESKRYTEPNVTYET